MKRWVILPLFCILSITLSAKTFHYIGFYDTGDIRIGYSVGVDAQALNACINDLTQGLAHMGYLSEVRTYTDSLCSKASLTAVLDNLQVAPDDIVFFFYDGHGIRAENDPDPFPQMCLGSVVESKFVPVTLVKNILLSKGARLNIIITECCNKEHKNVRIKPTQLNKSLSVKQTFIREICRQMFDLPQGTVMMTSSKAGEYSWCNRNSGGWFVNSFIDGWELLVNGELKADWDTFFSFVQSDCAKTAAQRNTSQHPYYEVLLNEEQSLSESPKEAYGDLNEKLNSLLDPATGKKDKFNIINEVKKQYFSPGTTVVTMLEDRITMIRFEDASDFLERLIFAKESFRVKVFKSETKKYYVYEY